MVRKTVKRAIRRHRSRQHRRSARHHRHTAKHHRRSARHHRCTARHHRRSARHHRRTAKRGGFVNLGAITRSVKQVGHLVSGKSKFVSVETAIYKLKQWAKQNDSTGMQIHYWEPLFDNYNNASTDADKVKYANSIIKAYNSKAITPYLDSIN